MGEDGGKVRWLNGNDAGGQIRRQAHDAACQAWFTTGMILDSGD